MSFLGYLGGEYLPPELFKTADKGCPWISRKWVAAAAYFFFQASWHHLTSAL